MFETEYAEAAVEVLDILDNTEEADVKKIPSDFIKFLVEIASSNYTTNLDHSKEINDMNILDKTREILGYIYINWWYNEQEREEYKEQINSCEQISQYELEDKHNTNDLFKRKKDEDSNTQTNDNVQNQINNMVKYKENFLKKICKKILRLFKDN